MATIKDGKRFFDEKNYEKAITALTSALSKDPMNLPGWLVLGAAYCHSDRLEAAEKCFVEHALKLDEAHYPSHYYLGLIYEKQARMLEAVSHYLTAAYAPQDSPVFKEASGRLKAILTRHKITPIVSDNPRLRSFGNEWAALIGGGPVVLLSGVVLGFPEAAVPIAGLYVFLFYVYIRVLSYFSHVDIYSDKIEIRKFRISWNQLRTDELIWLYQANQVTFTQSVPNKITGDAAIHVKTKVVTKTTREKPGEREEVLISGLGDHVQMHLICDLLRIWVKDEQAWLKRFLIE